MRKKKLWIVMLFVLGLAVILFFRPRSLAHLFGELEAETKIIRIDTIDGEWNEGEYSHEIATYEVDNAGDIQEILQIFTSFNYHYTLKLLGSDKEDPVPLGDGNLEGLPDSIRVTFVSSNENNSMSISFAGDKLILIDNQLYELDYFGNKKSEQLMEKLLSVISE